MTMSHVAIVRSSARMASHNAESDEKESTNQEASDNVENSLSNDLSHMSVISISSGSESGDISHEMSIRRSKRTGQSSKCQSSLAPKSIMASLGPLNTLSDIENCVSIDLKQLEVLQKLEQQWNAISLNFGTVLNYLHDCSEQVTKASMGCLESLVDSVDVTCDKVDEELKALYNVINKCDEMTTKLSAASSFHDEIKTLRKSIETLESLYKSKPQTVSSKNITKTQSPG